jgi:1-acyl-sn-glycerol-3-phosphate acyltransferase
MRAIFTAVRVVAIFVSILVFLTHMSLVWLIVRNRWRRIRWANRILSVYARWGLWVLRVRVRAIGRENLGDVRSGLFVGNHLTYMDVLAISSQMPTCFVTSTEIRSTPFLGQICIMAGCLFVERRNKQNILNEISEIREGLQVGLNVAIFPEATSTNGEQILRFRRPLFLSAIHSGRHVIPFCLNYHTVGGKPINVHSRDKIMWYGDMAFAPHLWALAGSGGVDLDLHFLTPIETEIKMDATELAQRAQTAVESVFRPVKKVEGSSAEPSVQP